MNNQECASHHHPLFTSRAGLCVLFGKRHKIRLDSKHPCKATFCASLTVLVNANPLSTPSPHEACPIHLRLPPAQCTLVSPRPPSILLQAGNPLIILISFPSSLPHLQVSLQLHVPDGIQDTRHKTGVLLQQAAQAGASGEAWNFWLLQDPKKRWSGECEGAGWSMQDNSALTTAGSRPLVRLFLAPKGIWDGKPRSAY